MHACRSTFKRGFVDTVYKRMADGHSSAKKVVEAMERDRVQAKLTVPQYIRMLEREQGTRRTKPPAKRRPKRSREAPEDAADVTCD